MSKLRKTIVLWVFSALFIFCGGYFFKLVTIDKETIIYSPYNKRLGVIWGNIKRGTIFDSGGNVIAETIRNSSGLLERVYHHESISHLIGEVGQTVTGLEASLNFELETLNSDILQRVLNVVFEEELYGNDAKLTIDAELCDYIYSQLKNRSGAVVVMDAETGKILASVSASEGKDDESKLFNRAFSGLYEPASTFKIVVTAAAFEQFGNEILNMEFECNGKTLPDGTPLQCFSEKNHGKISLRTAFLLSCNSYFAQLVQKLDNNLLLKTAESLYYNKVLNLDYETKISSFDRDFDIDKASIIQTAIGQGKTLVTPLQQCMIVSAIANNGMMMKPYLTDEITDFKGRTVKKIMPKAYGSVLSEDCSNLLKELMLACVEEGTGKPALQNGFDIFGKTGTGENASGIDNSWFVGFINLDGKMISVSILIEKSDIKASIIAGNIFGYIIDFAKKY